MNRDPVNPWHELFVYLFIIAVMLCFPRQTVHYVSQAGRWVQSITNPEVQEDVRNKTQ